MSWKQYLGIRSTHIFSLDEKLWPLRAPNFGHFYGKSRMVRGIILSKYIEGILRGLKGKFFYLSK